MLDDLRNHEAHPTPEERGWMELDLLAAATRAFVMVGFALLIGVAGSYAVSPDDPSVPTVALAGAPAP